MISLRNDLDFSNGVNIPQSHSPNDEDEEDDDSSLVVDAGEDFGGEDFIVCDCKLKVSKHGNELITSMT